MILARSRFVHLLPLGKSRFLAVHAVSHLRLTIDGDIARILDYFGRPRVMPEEMAPLVEALGYPQDAVLNTVANLMDRGLITDRSPEEELADIVIRALDVSRRLGIDIMRAIGAKHAYNVTRPFRHGKMN